MPISALLEAAALGELPEWSQVTKGRYAHVGRVATLLGEWADALSLSKADQIRWRAAGFLHDALRDAPPETLRPFMPAELRNVSGKLLHGPAAAERLRQDGVDDEPLLRAVAYHTIGHPEMDELGRALFIADYVEPGRRYDPARLAALRARMPAARNEVLQEVIRQRIQHLVAEGRMIRSETVAFWNVVTRHGHDVAQSS